MKNASRMARYMMMRNGSGNRENGDMRRDYRPDMRMGYGTEYERENEVRNGYGAYGNEGGNYVRDNYGVDNRFRDRRGREHYDNGRFAPVREMRGLSPGSAVWRGLSQFEATVCTACVLPTFGHQHESSLLYLRSWGVRSFSRRVQCRYGEAEEKI